MKSNINGYYNQVLSIEMMNKLEEAGIDTSDASCIWHSYVDDDYNPISWMPIFRTEETKIEVLRQAFPKTYKEGNLFYCYTVFDVIRKLPQFIDDYELVVNKVTIKYYDEYNEEKPFLFVYGDENMANTACKTLLWCKENGYL